MKKADLKKLAVGDHVIVTGTMDSKTFSGDTGVVIEPSMSLDVVIKFDHWHEGWSDTGGPDDCWGFEADQARNFTITTYVSAPKKPEPKPAKKRPHGKQEYKGNGKHDWEHVIGSTLRLRVPGGWLYGQYSTRISSVVNTTFVPVPDAVGYSV